MARATTPRWVTELVALVLREDGPPGRRPVIDWRTRGRVQRNTPVRVGPFSIRRGDFSRGQWDHRDTVTVWAGPHAFDQRMVLLHELAHWLTGGGHTPGFWELTWQLYLRHLPRRYWRYALASEGGYRAHALYAAERLGVPGARTLVERRRAQHPATQVGVSGQRGVGGRGYARAGAAGTAGRAGRAASSSGMATSAPPAPRRKGAGTPTRSQSRPATRLATSVQTPVIVP